MTNIKKITLQLFTVVILIITLLLSVSYYMFQKNSVGGEKYNELISIKNLQADVDISIFFVSNPYLNFLKLKESIQNHDTYEVEAKKSYFEERILLFEEKSKALNLFLSDQYPFSPKVTQTLTSAQEFFKIIGDYWKRYETIGNNKKAQLALYEEIEPKIGALYQENRTAVIELSKELYYYEKQSSSQLLEKSKQQHFILFVSAVLISSLILAAFYVLIKKQTLALQKLNIELNKSLLSEAKLNQELELHSHQLSVANTELESFSYSVAHDLRSPLRALNAFSKSLVEEHSASLNEEAKDYLNRIHQSSLKMSNLINDILSLSKISRESVVKQKTNISDLAKMCFQDALTNYPNHKVEIQIENNLYENIDPKLFKIALLNLMDNAIKYSSKKPNPRIEFYFDKNLNAYCIKDNGCGFDTKYLDKLFISFQRLHSSADYPGTGIGLATVMRVIRKHGGDVWASSVLNEGSIFYFSLPKEAV